MPIFQVEQVPLKKAEELMKIVEDIQICEVFNNKPVIDRQPMEEVPPKSQLEEVAEVLGAKFEEKKPIDPDDFSDLAEEVLGNLSQKPKFLKDEWVSFASNAQRIDRFSCDQT